GGALERRWGSARFAAFYLGSALISGLTVYATDLCWRGFAPADAPQPPPLTLGASGAALACLTAYTLLVEDRPALLFITRRHLIWMGMLLGAAGLLLLEERRKASDPAAPLSLLPQVAGIAVGAGLWLLMPGWDRFSRRRAELQQSQREERAFHLRLQVDRLLEKISRGGWESLSREERSFLQNASKHFRNPR
ncbi:MAG: rhomboid family intramembrane serine protease, partial [Thermoanaerobaculia bacterium]